MLSTTLRFHLIAAALLPLTLQGGGLDLFRAARDGDTPAIQAMLKSGADANARDEIGATPLLYAAAYGSLACVRVLLDAGADVNASTEQGSTALMWSTADAAKVKLLLARGARVNARTKDGGTALLSAAFRDNGEVFHALLAAGADPSGEMTVLPGGGPRLGLAKLAYASPDPALRAWMAEAKVPAPELKSLMPLPGSTPMTGAFLIATFSMWRSAGLGLDELLRDLMKLGADPNQNIVQFNRVLSPLARAALLDDVGAMRVLLDHGANPNAKGSQGTTPLMMAAATERPDPESIRLLLEHGAEVDRRDESGRTALDWALLQGESDVTRILREHGAVRGAPQPEPPRPVSKPRAAREAVRLAIARLQPAGPGLQSKTGCISCHNNSLPAIAVKVAKDHGVPVDQELAKHPTEATIRMWTPSREHFLMGDCSVFGFLGNAEFGLLAMAEEGASQNPITDATASCLSSLQRANGSWEGSDMRPPLAGRRPILYTALGIRALRSYSAPGMAGEARSRVARALAFLRTATPDNTQEQSFKLLGLIWAGAPAGEIQAERTRLLALQKENGSWPQRPAMTPDPFATGQAMYALHAAGVSPAAEEYRKGAAFLLSTQLDDGTWYMASRAVGFQPYLETGFPHGHDQFISAAATAWAAVALGYTL